MEIEGKNGARPIPESLRGQEVRTLEDWEKTSKALFETHAYKQFGNDREARNFLAPVLLARYLQWAKAGFKRKEEMISHPWFGETVFGGVRLWADALTHRERGDIAQWTYDLLGAEQAYGASHAIHNTGILPENISISYNRSMLGLVPTVEVPRSFFESTARWESNDHRARVRLAKEVADHTLNFSKKNAAGKVMVVDVGGGNGELAVALAKQVTNAKDLCIVVREPNHQMVLEGRAKVQKLRDTGEFHGKVIFLEGDVRGDIRAALRLGTGVQAHDKVTASEYANEPIVAAMSSFVFGAIDAEIVPSIVASTADNVSPGGLIAFHDFANPDSDRNAFLNQTGPSGKYFYRLHKFLAAPLQVNYRNWDHRVGGLWHPAENGGITIAKHTLRTEGLHTESAWNVTTVSILPVPPGILSALLQKGKSVGSDKTITCIPIPGYAEVTVRAIKPES